jgi:hypothetical protein
MLACVRLYEFNFWCECTSPVAKVRIVCSWPRVPVHEPRFLLQIDLISFVIMLFVVQLSELMPSKLPVGDLLMVVLDEADHIMSPWSRPAAEALLKAVTSVSHRPQIVFVGATTTGGLFSVAREYLKK